MLTKICKACEIEKPIHEFRKDHAYYALKCKACSSTKCKNEHCNNRSYNNRQCTECYRKAIGGKKKHLKIVGIKQWLSICLNSTKQCSPARLKRGYRVKENDLTIEFLLDLYNKQNGKCHISGIELKTEYKNICSASIDRIDPEIGYLQNNVALTCQWVNMGRNRTTMEDFKKILMSLDFSQQTITKTN